MRRCKAIVDRQFRKHSVPRSKAVYRQFTCHPMPFFNVFFIGWISTIKERVTRPPDRGGAHKARLILRAFILLSVILHYRISSLGYSAADCTRHARQKPPKNPRAVGRHSPPTTNPSPYLFNRTHLHVILVHLATMLILPVVYFCLLQINVSN